MTGPEVPGMILKGGGGRGTRLPAPSLPQVHRLFNPPPAPPSHNYDDGTVGRSCPDKGLSKQQCYYYDAEAVREPAVSGRTAGRPRIRGAPKYARLRDPLVRAGNAYAQRPAPESPDRHKRSFWVLATEPFHGSHTATFPTKLVEPCVLAGTSAAGCCSACGQPFERVLEVTYRPLSKRREGRNDPRIFEIEMRQAREAKTLGWRPTCECGAPSTPAVVMDPFAGTGTTLKVAKALGRHGVGIELRDEYLRLIKDRLSHEAQHSLGPEQAA
jgi:site-specific DNA-methyltransferase (adenine-specific)